MRLTLSLSRRSRAWSIVAAVCLATLLCSHTAPAETPRDTKPVESVISPELSAEPSPAPHAQHQLAAQNPMMKEIAELLQAEGAAVAELEAKLDELTLDADILHLMREVERVKRETEWAILRIQAAFAREAGKLEQAQRIESALEQLQQSQKGREARAHHAEREGGSR